MGGSNNNLALQLTEVLSLIEACAFNVFRPSAAFNVFRPRKINIQQGSLYRESRQNVLATSSLYGSPTEPFREM